MHMGGGGGIDQTSCAVEVHHILVNLTRKSTDTLALNYSVSCILINKI